MPIAIVEPGVITADLKAAARAQKLFYPPDPGEHERLQHRRKHCDERRRSALFEVRRHAQLRDRSRSRAGKRRSSANRRARAQKQNRFRFDRPVRRLGRNARRRHRNHAAIAAAAAGARDLVGRIRENVAKRRRRFRKFLPKDFCRRRSKSPTASRWKRRAKIWARRLCRPATRICWSILTDRKRACGARRTRFANCSRRKNRTRSRWRPAKKNCEKLWALRRQFSNSLRATGLTKLNQDVVVPRSRIVDLVEFAEKLQREITDFRSPVSVMPVTATFTSTSWPTDYNRDAAVREKVERALDELFAQVLAWGGVITGEHGIGLAKKRWWPEATSEIVRELHRKLKASARSGRNFESGKIC